MFKPHKELGQNFLTDKTVASDMISGLDLKKEDEIIEIGPGRGIVTRALIDTSKNLNVKIHAVEIDKKLFNNLVDIFSGEGIIEFHNDDILNWLPKFSSQKDFKIIGSIPYYITSPIIHQIIKMKKMPKTSVLLIQKEVAEKIKSKVPDSSYMSSFVQTFFNVKYLGKVPSKKFYPEPKVDGGILKLERRDGDFSLDFIRKYEGFLHKAYSNPRKMLNKMFEKEELERGRINPSLRAQNLSADDWLSFYRVLNEI